jgi:hypothetical protein
LTSPVDQERQALRGARAEGRRAEHAQTRHCRNRRQGARRALDRFPHVVDRCDAAHLRISLLLRPLLGLGILGRFQHRPAGRQA